MSSTASVPTATPSGHRLASRTDWLAARRELLAAEKELTRQSDRLARQRRDLPWVRLGQAYRFETAAGPHSLADLFQGRSQLLVYHFMFGPDYAAGCPSCSSIADTFSGIAPHLAGHDVMFWAVSRAPLAKLQAFQRRLGWTFPWASSAGSDFNADFCASHAPEQEETGVDYNFTTSPRPALAPGEQPAWMGEIAAKAGTDWMTYQREAPGMSAFALEDGVVYHTYSAYARGLDVLWSLYQWLDRAPLGRNETGPWLCHRDSYGPASQPAPAACCGGR